MVIYYNGMLLCVITTGKGLKEIISEMSTLKLSNPYGRATHIGKYVKPTFRALGKMNLSVPATIIGKAVKRPSWGRIDAGM
tara:strand:- start:32 stop:274 length:243 start_codon:yes stop_codon:yes gene_type:complete